MSGFQYIALPNIACSCLVQEVNMPREYINLLKRALAQIEPEYFKLATTYRRKGIVRERIFCYELYHQMRLLMPINHRLLLHNELTLHGEIDKSGHRDFAKQDQANPDFVFHAPGTHAANTLVIEVKGRITRKGILKDFQTLLAFIGNYGYQAGAFVLYNHPFAELVNVMEQNLRELSASHTADAIYILAIARAGIQCEEHRLSSLHRQ